MIMEDIIKELLKPLLEKLIAYIDKNNYWPIYAILLLPFIFAGVVGWWMGTRKVRSEIRNLNVETQGKKAELLSKVQECRQNFKENAELLGLSIQEIINALQQKDAALIEKNRIGLATLFFNELLPSFDAYMEHTEVYLDIDGSKKERMCFIDDEIFRLFRFTENFLASVNNPKILSFIGRQKITISKETLNATTRFIKKNVNKIDFGRKKRLKEYLQKFGFS